MMYGRIKRTLSRKCPECGKNLQIRVIETDSVINGIPVKMQSEFICCSNENCDYEEEYEQKKRNKRTRDTLDY